MILKCKKIKFKYLIDKITIDFDFLKDKNIYLDVRLKKKKSTNFGYKLSCSQ